MVSARGWLWLALVSAWLTSGSFGWAPRPPGAHLERTARPGHPRPCLLPVEPRNAARRHVVCSQRKPSASEASVARDKVWGWDSETVERVVEQDAAKNQDALNFDWWFWGAGEAGGAQQAVFHADERPVVLFDGVCNFCDASVNFFMEKDSRKQGTFRFAAQQSDVGRILLQQHSGKDPEELKSIVLLTREDMFCKSDAVLRIARELQEPFRTLSYLGAVFPLAMRDQIYDWVSENRKIFGEKTSCRIPEEEEMERFIG